MGNEFVVSLPLENWRENDFISSRADGQELEQQMESHLLRLTLQKKKKKKEKGAVL
jgi:hypothetical protein